MIFKQNKGYSSLHVTNVEIILNKKLFFTYWLDRIFSKKTGKCAGRKSIFSPTEGSGNWQSSMEGYLTTPIKI